MKYLAVDIGGTRIKATIGRGERLSDSRDINQLQVKSMPSPLRQSSSGKSLCEIILRMVEEFGTAAHQIGGIGISTTGMVDYAGTKILNATGRLKLFETQAWKEILEDAFKCSVHLVNDADAATIGLSEVGRLRGNKIIGVMPIGTGVGFTVWNNGRRWRPGGNYTLLGSVVTPLGNYDSIVSASTLANKDPDSRLTTVLTAPEFAPDRKAYLQNLAPVIVTGGILYSLDEVIVCGGLADAAHSCDFPLEEQLRFYVGETSNDLIKPLHVHMNEFGNKLQLVGALALARGEAITREKTTSLRGLRSSATEEPYAKLQLQAMGTKDILNSLWRAEQEAGISLESSLDMLERMVDLSTERLIRAGRLIYVGAGTSGRIASIDAVEIPCTYGFPADRVLAVIAGGVADAAIAIEMNFEEDASGVPEMLMLNIDANDVVVGITCSGTAYFVHSALAFCKSRGALCALVHEGEHQFDNSFYDSVICLRSGKEIVAGSTRMKGGTATKKVLNFLSSTIMIKMGKVIGPYMIEFACVNNKLVERAQRILNALFDVPMEDTLAMLEENGMNLSNAIRDLPLKKWQRSDSILGSNNLS